MASPLSVTPNPHNTMAVIDPTRKSQYALQLPDELLREIPTDFVFNSVRLNHKPSHSQSDGSRTTELRSFGRDAFSLDITDGEDDGMSAYHYEGRRAPLKSSYVLVFDPNSQACTLQPLTASYNFNLRSTPWESSAEKLKDQYPQALDHSSPSSATEPLDILFDDASDEEPDENNPFDYRHQLHRTRTKPPSPSPSPAVTATSTVSSSKATPRERATFNSENKVSKTQRPTTKRGGLPKIRMDRRASERPRDDVDARPANKPSQSTREEQQRLSVPKTSSVVAQTLADVDETMEDEDDFIPAGGSGGLEIDFGDSAPQQKRQRALTLTGSQHDGPISLRSAANSPRSQVNTPRRGRQDYDDFVMELGSTREEDDEDGADDDADASEEDDNSIAHTRTKSRGNYYESDGNGDVESITIGSPAHGPTEASSHEVLTEDDYEKQMLEGLTQAMDSESESEAE